MQAHDRAQDSSGELDSLTNKKPKPTPCSPCPQLRARAALPAGPGAAHRNNMGVEPPGAGHSPLLSVSQPSAGCGAAGFWALAPVPGDHRPASSVQDRQPNQASRPSAGSRHPVPLSCQAGAEPRTLDGSVLRAWCSLAALAGCFRRGWGTAAWWERKASSRGWGSPSPSTWSMLTAFPAAFSAYNRHLRI